MTRLQEAARPKPKSPVEPLAADDVIRELATIIHDTMCHANHTDGCGWDYENWTDKIWYARSDYLRRAEVVVNLLVESGTPKEDIDLDLIANMFYLSKTWIGR